MSTFLFKPPDSFPFRDFSISIIYDKNAIKKISFINMNDSRTHFGKFEMPYSSSILSLISILDDYFSNGFINHRDALRRISVNLNQYSEFGKKIISQIIAIPAGEVVTYGEIARKIGSKAYQAIGNFLRTNKYPIIIPCHRVVAKNGIGGFMGETSTDSFEIQLKNTLIKFERSSIQK